MIKFIKRWIIEIIAEDISRNGEIPQSLLENSKTNGLMSNFYEENKKWRIRRLN